MQARSKQVQKIPENRFGAITDRVHKEEDSNKETSALSPHFSCGYVWQLELPEELFLQTHISMCVWVGVCVYMNTNGEVAGTY